MRINTAVFKPMSYDDDIILNIIRIREPHMATFKLALKQYRTRISENRLLFMRNKKHNWAFAFDDDANKMQKKLDLVLSQKGYTV